MEKVSVNRMNARFALPNGSFDFLQFKHSNFFLKYPNPNLNPSPNPNPNLLRLRRLNCSVSDGTVPSSVGATDSALVVKFLFRRKLQRCLLTSKGPPYFCDSLVEEALGGALAEKSFTESDTKGFYESETEVLKQLSSMGRLVVCAGNGAVTSPTNLALLRHGITLWIDVPVDLVARDVIEDESQFTPSEIPISGSYPEVKDELGAIYVKYRAGYATADAIISVQKVASRLGCDNLDEVTREDLTLEALKEIEKLTRVKKMIEEAARPF
ncbi:probable inactive shikimate kinase like 1, chloroplastic isoform X3 [Phaseolus vulgaris]|uniref:probable inactive shikimate kinase like 1, chloroplastic isoform X3 n=1 Tax=Phaseolus vulgaris TaxID=3885 RepID=UPI0035CBCD29